ncbi:MAG: hypothetical protein ACI9AQ_001481 [Dinoroseobacter sp.]|jgi:hypothetical protein
MSVHGIASILQNELAMIHKTGWTHHQGQLTLTIHNALTKLFLRR